MNAVEGNKGFRRKELILSHLLLKWQSKHDLELLYLEDRMRTNEKYQAETQPDYDVYRKAKKDPEYKKTHARTYKIALKSINNKKDSNQLDRFLQELKDKQYVKTRWKKNKELFKLNESYFLDRWTVETSQQACINGVTWKANKRKLRKFCKLLLNDNWVRQEIYHLFLFVGSDIRLYESFTRYLFGCVYLGAQWRNNVPLTKKLVATLLDHPTKIRLEEQFRKIQNMKKLKLLVKEDEKKLLYSRIAYEDEELRLAIDCLFCPALFYV